MRKDRERGHFLRPDLARDEGYMRQALKLALKGRGKTSPNPIVGALVVSDGKIIGQGYHKKAGGPHAEVSALRQAGREAKGATLYVTLEPCCFTGKTPPCVDAILNKGIKRVVVATKDPNPLNDGRGIRLLRSKGIDIDLGILKDEANKINEVFFKFITRALPFVTVKVAQTLDGKIATETGESKWITDEAARRYVHTMRSQVDAILVGIGTVLKDDPMLTARISRHRSLAAPAFVKTSSYAKASSFAKAAGDRLALRRYSPNRVILDSRLRIPLTSKILSSKPFVPTIIATTRYAPNHRIKALEARGTRVLIVKDKDRKVSLRSLMKELAKLDITNLLIEGGPGVITSAFKERLVDKALFFISPKIVGGKDALTPVEGAGVKRMSDAIKLRDVKIKKFGEDILVEGYPVYK